MIPSRTRWRMNPADLRGYVPVTEILEPGVDALPIRIEIWQDSVLTGWDHGPLGFEDGAIWFSGRICSFLLAPDALTEGRHSRRLTLRHPRRKVWITLTVLFDPRRVFAQDCARLDMEIARLRDSVATQASQYPPLGLRPDLYVDEKPLWKGITTCAGILFAATLALAALAIAIFVSMIFSDPWPLYVILVAIVVAAIAWAVRASRRSTLLRTIRQEEPA